MKKEIKPGVAAAVIAVTVLVIGVFIYTRSVSGGKPMKPGDALKQAGFKDQLRAAYDAKYGSH
jgi:ABC-type spermidine/putrescine transport system permease subunit I